MGYEMGLCRAGMRDSEFNLDDVYWWSCGWDKTDLHDALARVADSSFSGDCYSVVRVPVDKLMFISKMASQVRANPILEWADKLGSLDCDWREEFLDGLSPELRAASRISYFVDGLDECEDEVASIIANLAEYHDFDVRSLGDAIDALVAKGISEVDLFGS
jgi:hypothetical protein